MPYRHVFAVDPGDVRNGFCYLKYDTEKKVADVKIMKTLNQDALADMLKVIWGVAQAGTGDDKPHITMVCENFRIRPEEKAKFGWSEMQTIRVIGRVEQTAHLLECQFVTQEPAILSMARKWVPFKVNKGHLEDSHSAFMHGGFFLLNKKLINTMDQVTFFGQEKL